MKQLSLHKKTSKSIHTDVPTNKSSSRPPTYVFETEETFEGFLTARTDSSRLTLSLKKTSDIAPLEIRNFKRIFHAQQPRQQAEQPIMTDDQKNNYFTTESETLSSKIRSNSIRGTKTGRSFKIGSMTERSKDYSESLISDLKMSFKASAIKKINPGNNLQVKTDISQMHPSIPVLTENGDLSVGYSHSNFAEEGFLQSSRQHFKSLIPSSYTMNKVPESQRSWRGEKGFSFGDLKSLAQQSYNRLQENNKLGTQYETNASEKEIKDRLEESPVVHIKKDLDAKVKVFKRNKDTMAHLLTEMSSTKPVGFFSQQRTPVPPKTASERKFSMDYLGYSAKSARAKRNSQANTAIKKDIKLQLKSSAKSVSVKVSNPAETKPQAKQLKHFSTQSSIHPDVKNKNFLGLQEYLSNSTETRTENAPERNILVSQRTINDMFAPSKPLMKLASEIETIPERNVLVSQRTINDMFAPSKPFMKLASGIERTERIDVEPLEDNPEDTQRDRSEIDCDQLLLDLKLPEGLNRMRQHNLKSSPSKYNKLLLESIPAEYEQTRIEVNKVRDTTIWLESSAGQGPTNEFTKPFSKNRRLLNEYDIKVVREEFEKKDEGVEPNFEHIDSLVCGLNFFAKLSKSIRLRLLRNAFFAHYDTGATIFKQGDYGDLMYVILRGSVNVRTMKPTPFGTLVDVISAVIYDGFHFGEYALMGTAQKNKNRKKTDAETHDAETGQASVPPISKKGTFIESKEKILTLVSEDEVMQASPPPLEEAESPVFKERTKRTATIVVSESCDLLCIPRERFKFIFLNQIQKELDAKVRILLSMPFFSEMDPYLLIPVANNLELAVYEMGDVIVKAGEMIDRLYIISSGRCKAVMETVNQFDTKPPVSFRGIVPPLGKLSHGLVDYSCQETMKRDDGSELDSGPKKRPEAPLQLSGKSFDRLKIDMKKDIQYYNEHIPFKDFTRGDYFGGRSLISREDVSERNDPLNKLSMLSKPAGLTVVADAAVVEVFYLDREHYSYIPDFLSNILLQGLKNQKEYDEYDVLTEKKAVEQWQSYKDQQVSEVVHKKLKEDSSYYKKF